MEEIFQNLGQNALWSAESASPSAKSFEATEVWLDTATGEINTIDKTVDEADFDAWHSEESRVKGDKACCLILRFAWLDVDSDKKIVNVSETLQKSLLRKFDLKLAYSYARSFLDGTAALPPVRKPNKHQRAYAFCHVPKLAAIWSHKSFPRPSDRHSVTEGIIFVPTDEKTYLKKILHSSTWDISLWAHPMFPALLFSISLSARIVKGAAPIKAKVKSAEGRTGIHNYKKRDEKSSKELSELAADIMGSATKLASMERKSKTVQRLLSFILQMVHEEDADREKGSSMNYGCHVTRAAESGPDAASRLKHHVELLKDRLSMQDLDNDYTSKRVQVQIDAVSPALTLTLGSFAAHKVSNSSNCGLAT